MAASLQAKLSQILPLVKQKLVDDEVFTADQIDYTTTDDLGKIDLRMGDKDCWLWPRAEVPDPKYFVSAPRHDRRVDRQLAVILRSRLELDESASARLWLTNTTTGHLDLEDAVIESLDNFFPTDARGNEFTLYGLKCLGVEPPRAGPQAGWGWSVVTFDLRYRRKLSPER